MVSKTRKIKTKQSWGYHLIVNAGGCDPAAIRSKEIIASFAKELVKRIDMVAYGSPIIKHFGLGNKLGYSLVQLIETSDITAHFVEETNDIYLDIFSCKSFKEKDAMDVFNKYFKPVTVEKRFLIRQAKAVIPKKKIITITGHTFEILDMQRGQNPYERGEHINSKKAEEEHEHLEKAFSQITKYKINPQHSIHLPDIVFVANGGLCLPRLKEPLVILPWMKYPQRRDELPFLKQMFKKMDIKTVPFPGSHDAPFEGQAEIKWFNGGAKAIGAYGFRSTMKTFRILNKMLNKIYKANGLVPPELLIVPIASFDYYHLDVGMLEYNDTSCIIHKKAFSPTSVQKIKNFLGAANVHIIDTSDKFCLNAVVDGNNLITHKLNNVGLKNTLEKITGKQVVQVDTTEFEKSGGSVRCMTLDIFV